MMRKALTMGTLGRVEDHVAVRCLPLGEGLDTPLPPKQTWPFAQLAQATLLQNPLLTRLQEPVVSARLRGPT
jgi:hypothetical protein